MLYNSNNLLSIYQYIWNEWKIKTSIKIFLVNITDGIFACDYALLISVYWLVL